MTRLLLHPQGPGQWLLGSLGWTAGWLVSGFGLLHVCARAGVPGYIGLCVPLAAKLLIWAQVVPHGRRLPAWATLAGPWWLKLAAYGWFGAMLLLHIHWGLLAAWLLWLLPGRERNC